MLKRSFLVSLACLCLPLLGCGSEDESSGLARQQKEAADPLEGRRTTLEGNWLLVVSGGGKDQLPAIFQVAAKGKGGTMKLTVLEFSDVLRRPGEPTPADGPKLTSSEAKEGELDFTLDIYGSEFSFRGRLLEGMVVGDIVVDGTTCSPGLLMPTEESSFEGKPTTHESFGVTELNTGLQKAPDKFTFLTNWATTNPTSPLALTALHQAVMNANVIGLKEEELKRLTTLWIETAERWGPRLEQLTRVQIATTLAYSEYDPAVVFNYLDEAAKHLKSSELVDLQARIDDARQQTRMVEAIAQLASDDATKQQEGVALLKEVRQEQPFNTEVVYALAQYDAAHDAEGEAMALYAELVVLPFLERQTLEIAQQRGVERVPPSTALEELWKQKHGNDEGLEAFLDQTYQERFTAFAQPRIESRTEGNRVALIELFTGAQCPPCVGADAALSGIEKTFPLDQVVVLRYHQHIPGPDPLANDASESRFYYYRGTGTPKVVINGDGSQQYSGYMLHAKLIYDAVKERLAETLKQTTDVVVSADAEIREGKLSVRASVTGFDPSNSRLRLRLVVAEDDVEFLAANHVRRHEMVVRGILSGPDGIASENDELKYSGSTDLVELRNSLADYIHRFEQGRGQKFPVKPLAMDKLHLVALIQDDETREVLQAVAVPVRGEISYPPLPAPRTNEEPASEKPDGKQPSAEGTSATAPKKDGNDSGPELKPPSDKSEGESKPKE